MPFVPILHPAKFSERDLGMFRQTQFIAVQQRDQMTARLAADEIGILVHAERSGISMMNVHVDITDASGRRSTRRAVVDLREIATGTDDRVGVRDPQPGPQVTFLFGNLM